MSPEEEKILNDAREAARMGNKTTRMLLDERKEHAQFAKVMSGVTKLSRWIDSDTPVDPRSSGWLWYRLTKVCEEAGEVISALTGASAWSKRKGLTHSMADVKTELLDTVVAALGAYEHLDGNKGTVGPALEAHVRFLLERAGLE